MNVIWSSYVQGIRTLYDSRKLRFDDRFFGQYRPLFGLDAEKDGNRLWARGFGRGSAPVVS